MNFKVAFLKLESAKIQIVGKKCETVMKISCKHEKYEQKRVEIGPKSGKKDKFRTKVGEKVRLKLRKKVA